MYTPSRRPTNVRVAQIVAALAVAPLTLVGQSKRPVTAADMIRMTEIAGNEPWGDGIVRPAVFSRDGKYFAFVIERGDLEKNHNIASIILFRTADAFTRPKPDTLATTASSSSRPAIGTIRWLPGDTALVFVGERPGENAQLWTVGLKGRTPRRLTTAPANISTFDMSPDGNRAFYITEYIPDSALAKEQGARGFLVTQDVRDVLRGRWDLPPDQEDGQGLFVLSVRDRVSTRVDNKGLGDCLGQPSVSPAGRFVMMTCYDASAPKEWEIYADPKQAWQRSRVPLRILVDMEKAQAKRLIDAPAWSAAASWSPDGRLVVVPSTQVPLADLKPAERSNPQPIRAAIMVDPATGARSVLIRRDSLELARWGSDGQAVVLRTRDASKTELAFKREGATWVSAAPASVPAAAAKATSAPIDVFVEQDLNTPPRIVATGDGGKRATVFDPNPQFTGLAFGREEVMTWQTSDGEWEGGLYYPVGYTPGKRYPLVIQTHGFSKDRFQIAGYGVTGYAGQALAGHGIVVLQVGDGPAAVARKATATKEEGPFNVRGLEAAIDALDKKGLIDRNKVALEGWSRTTYHVRHMMVNSTYPIAAALISDGYDGSYFRWVINEGAHNELESITGGPPVGEWFKTWRERTPTLNPEKFNAPIRIEAIAYPGGGGPLTQWELYALLKRLNKPVEMVYFPRGEHSLKTPWERLTSQGGAVDWFRFWLKGEEDNDPSKQAQYARWRAMRKSPPRP